MKKTLHIFRHGLTDWNLAKKLQGHTDIPLNSQGRAQAAQLQTFFEKNPVEIFLTSDLKRALETTQIANEHLRRPVQESKGLREAFLGAIEGLSLEEAQLKFGLSAWEKWSSINPCEFDFCYPEGESSNQVIQRMTETLQNFCESNEFKSAGVCTHGFAMRRFLHSLNVAITQPIPIPNCIVYTCTWDLKNNKFEFYFKS